MTVDKFMKNNLNVIKNKIIKGISEDTFDSHEFIRHFMREFELEYVGFLNSNNVEPFRNINAQIAHFLSMNKNLLGIKDDGKTKSLNIFGIESPNERWIKVS